MSDTEERCDERKCFKYKDHLYESLNIAYNETNCFVIFWNKYQIFIHENYNFENSRVITPDFLIHQLIVASNYILCLDKDGNVLTTSLKFKATSQKRFKSSFQTKLQNVLAFTTLSEDSLLCLNFKHLKYYLTIHKINSELTLNSKTVLEFTSERIMPCTNLDRCQVISITLLSEANIDVIEKMFSLGKNTWRDHNLIMFTFDKLVIYSCIIGSKLFENKMQIKQFFTSPSSISNIQMLEEENFVAVFVPLSSGTILKLTVPSQHEIKNIIHLNTALFKCMIMKKIIIYSDGVTMWKAENYDTSNQINLKQFFVHQVKDFMTFSDQIICTTFSNLIYTLPLDDDKSYIMPLSNDEYVKADTLLNNCEYLYAIMKEIEKNQKLIKEVKEEGHYITALSLSNRKDVMTRIIENKIIVYDEYDEVKDQANVILPEKLCHYYKLNTIYFLIKIKVNENHVFNEVLYHLLHDFKLHITLLAQEKTLKTISIDIVKIFQEQNILVPLQTKDVEKINILLELVTNIQGALDKKQKVWMLLYQSQTSFTSEHFIKNKTSYLKPKYAHTDIENLVYEIATNQNGNLFSFTNIKLNEKYVNHSYYIKLPNNFKDIFKNATFHKENICKKKALYISKLFNLEEFLNGRCNISFDVGSDKVSIEIINEFSILLLKVTSTNTVKAYHMRHFIANFVYGNVNNLKNVYVDYVIYTATENIKKKLQDHLNSCEKLPPDNLAPIIEQFQKNVIVALPM